MSIIVIEINIILKKPINRETKSSRTLSLFHLFSGKKVIIILYYLLVFGRSSNILCVNQSGMYRGFFRDLVHINLLKYNNKLFELYWYFTLFLWIFCIFLIMETNNLNNLRIYVSFIINFISFYLLFLEVESYWTC